ncbi:hypothetical protein PF005_g18597 [Phytophthora fragariae]|uniref:Uncharacterized protein n=1 Tax=Phytophthora fragariae TaxID=53985 RepID=A0A6A3EID7_9STRA|nr:hypothetical protein PF009_g18266 [Phytophthora fragariae]KAE8992833.1 hypothetical protein PF011_g17389 [Phytophthora fragariae]KAE9092629.1 hypothetical protein PF010_g17779 [Phytophthora fragariae]KAE9097672.1 hypothetical protein PF007_g16542 [Phytophthora fragariae]KAE9122810.1 hypothetical protein PF006_g17568 [Phytophthora fragariae]
MPKPTKLLLTVAFAMSLLCLSSAVELRLFPSQPASRNPRYKKFTFSGIQVCYSLDSCYNNIAVSVDWMDATRGYHFVFFEGSQCTGKALPVSNFVASGSVDFTKVDFANKLSSFMLAGASNYAIHGLEDLCEDEDAILTELASNISLET